MITVSLMHHAEILTVAAEIDQAVSNGGRSWSSGTIRLKAPFLPTRFHFLIRYSSLSKSSTTELMQ